MLDEMFAGVVKQTQHFTQQRKTIVAFDLIKFVQHCQTNVMRANKVANKPNILSNFVFKMLGEMFDLFDLGLKHHYFLNNLEYSWVAFALKLPV